MIPQKAMNTLDAMQEDYEGGDYPDQEEALKLGIEALERCRSNYLNPQQADFRRLPSETGE